MLVKLEDFDLWRKQNNPTKLIAVNGCFDILHVGHIDVFEQARALGSHLVVGLNSDESIKRIKGPSRPINREEWRAKMLSALRYVDAVCIFKENDASNFLRAVKPNIVAKGGDYSYENLNPAEKAVYEEFGIKLQIVPITFKISTTKILSQEKKT